MTALSKASHDRVEQTPLGHLHLRASWRSDGAVTWAIVHDGVAGEVGVVSGFVDDAFAGQLRAAADMIESGGAA